MSGGAPFSARRLGAMVRRGLDDWIRRNELSAPRVCWIETSGFPRPR